MKVNDENQAYRIFANGLMAHLGNEYWKQMSNHVDIYEGMTQSSKVIITINGNKIEEYRELSNELLFLEHDASLFLRNHIINLTGEKIWGLTFTLYPDGKFEIEYDYDKPKDYEETDEVITGDEINQTFISDNLKSWIVIESIPQRNQLIHSPNVLIDYLKQTVNMEPLITDS